MTTIPFELNEHLSTTDLYDDVTTNGVAGANAAVDLAAPQRIRIENALVTLTAAIKAVRRSIFICPVFTGSWLLLASLLAAPMRNRVSESLRYRRQVAISEALESLRSAKISGVDAPSTQCMYMTLLGSLCAGLYDL